MDSTDDPLRVLLVEDNPGDAALIEERLGALDDREFEPAFDVVHVVALRHALERLASNGFDIVLLDLGLPESTGIATAERVLSDSPDVPVVVLTGLANRATALEAIRAGAQDYLNKDEHLDGPIIARAIRYAIERHERERALQHQTERIQQVASVISHELRNPLNIARGYTDMLDPDTDHEYVASIDEALERIDVLVEKLVQLTDLGAVEALEAVDVGRVAEETWQHLETEGAALELTAPLPTVAADPDRLSTMFEHLFRNAVEHGGEAVTVTVGQLEDDRGFFVADDGPGLGTQDPRMFEPALSLGGADPELGLAIVGSVVEEHGWQIRSVESEAGGARIEVGAITSGRPAVDTHLVDVDPSGIGEGDPPSGV